MPTIPVSLTITLTEDQARELSADYRIELIDLPAEIREHILNGVRTCPMGEYWTAVHGEDPEQDWGVAMNIDPADPDGMCANSDPSLWR